jgi:hypothetical protein
MATPESAFFVTPPRDPRGPAQTIVTNSCIKIAAVDLFTGKINHEGRIRPLGAC